MAKQIKKKGVTFFERGSWYHRTKEMLENGQVRYGKIGGFISEEEAEESYYKIQAIFESEQRKYYVSTNKDIMFKDYLIYWFENIYSERIETTTRMVGAYALYDLIIPNIDYDIKIRLVTTDYLNEIILKASLMTSSGGATSRAILFIAFKDAFINNYISNNPVKETTLYRRKKPSITVLRKKELKKFLTKSKNTEWYLEILLGLFCGLRKGEILGLKFSDFSLEEESVTITRQLVSNPIIKKGERKISKYELIERPPKTDNSYRKLKVPTIILKELKNRKKLINLYKDKKQNEFEDNDYISCQPDGKPHHLSSMNTCLIRMCQRISLPNISVHGLRHMYATILIEQGVSLAKIKGVMGHSSIHTTFEYYCEVMDEKEKILAFMNNVFIVEEEKDDMQFEQETIC